MLQKIDYFLNEFKKCFSYKSTRYWFMVVILGFIVRCDHYGVTSFVRWLFLDPENYNSILHFFRSNSWQLDIVLEQWVHIVKKRFPIIKVNGRAVLLGDGIKVSKEAKRMPGVKSLHQDSDDSGKPEFFLGHHFGYIGLLAGRLGKLFCVPIEGRLHEGVDSLRVEKGLDGAPATIVTRMARLALNAAKQMGCPCYIALDAYFAVSPTFRILKEQSSENKEQLVHVVTRAKKNYVAFLGKKKVTLADCFDFPQLFEEAEVEIYGATRTIEYLWLDLFWQPVEGLLRFVWIKDGKGCYVLMCSDLHLDPLEIMKIYSYRTKIEVMFLFLKQVLGGFAYRFWSKICPKVEKGVKPDYSELDEDARKKVSNTIEAIERFVNLAGIALGTLQYLALNYTSKIWNQYQGWLRTYSSDVPSEEIVRHAVQAEFFNLEKAKKVQLCPTLRDIFEKREMPTVPVTT